MCLRMKNTFKKSFGGYHVGSLGKKNQKVEKVLTIVKILNSWFKVHQANQKYNYKNEEEYQLIRTEFN